MNHRSTNLKRTLFSSMLVAATVPLLLIAAPLASNLFDAARQSAHRELELRAASLGAELAQSYGQALVEAESLAGEGDLQRATRTVLLRERAEARLENYLARNPLAARLFLLDEKSRVAARVPIDDESTPPYLGPTSTTPFALAADSAGPAFEISATGFSVGVSVRWQGKPQGELLVYFPLARLREFLEKRVPSPFSARVTTVAAAAADQTTANPPSPKTADGVQVETFAKIGENGPRLRLTLEEPAASRFGALRRATLGYSLGALALIAFFALGGLAVARRLGGPIDRELAEARQTERSRGEAEKAALEAELKRLQTQIQPHFLFNVLNNVATLVPSDPASSVEMLRKLSDLYRVTLTSAEADTVSGQEELELARNYLDLQKMRFGSRLAYEVESDDRGRAARVPAMLALTLVENAVKHGIARARAGGLIRIRLTEREGLIELTVFNTGAGISVPNETEAGEPADARAGLRAAAGTGTGLKNIRQRLHLLYAGQARFSLAAEGSGTLASARFPGERSLR